MTIDRARGRSLGNRFAIGLMLYNWIVHPAINAPFVMTQILTWEQMTEKFNGEWLLIIHAELDEYMGIISGEVIAHSPNQGEIYDALPLRKGYSACIEYIGEVPEDLAFIL